MDEQIQQAGIVDMLSTQRKRWWEKGVVCTELDKKAIRRVTVQPVYEYKSVVRI